MYRMNLAFAKSALQLLPREFLTNVTIMSIPWIRVLYKKRKRIAKAVSFLLLVIVRVVGQILREDQECYGDWP